MWVLMLIMRELLIVLLRIFYLLCLSLGLTTHAAAAPVYAWAEINGTIYDSTPAADPSRVETSFNDGGQGTTASISENLGFSAASGGISVLGRSITFTANTTSSRSTTGVDTTGYATMSGRIASGFEVVSPTLAPGTPITANLEWILGGLVEHAYGYAYAGFSASARQGGMVGPNSSLFNFDFTPMEWAVGNPISGATIGSLSGGTDIISLILSGTETLRVGDIFTIIATPRVTTYSWIYSDTEQGAGSAVLNASFNLSSTSNVIFQPLAAVPLPASLPLILSGLLSMFGIAKRGSRQS